MAYANELETCMYAGARKEADGRYGYNFDPRWFTVEPGGAVELSKIQCPTLVVRGERSSLLTARSGLASSTCT